MPYASQNRQGKAVTRHSESKASAAQGAHEGMRETSKVECFAITRVRPTPDIDWVIMDWKVFGTAFLTLFLAELGDKTQLAVITMSAKAESKISVLLGACLALIAVTILAVTFGGILSQYVPTEWLQRIVAIGFIVIGILMLFGIL